MSKSKKVEPALIIAGAIHNATTILTNRISALGGNYTKALVRIGTGEKRYDAKIGQLAKIYSEISNASGITAPEGGEIHILRDVMVDESLGLDLLINMSCPKTPASYLVHRVAEYYPAQVGSGVKPVALSIVLVNFGREIPNIHAPLAWGRENNLSIASPRTVLTVVLNHPSLHIDLRIDPMVIVSTEEHLYSGSPHTMTVWLKGDNREANFGWSNGKWSVHAWFAFICEVLPAA